MTFVTEHLTIEDKYLRAKSTSVATMSTAWAIELAMKPPVMSRTMIWDEEHMSLLPERRQYMH